MIKDIASQLEKVVASHVEFAAKLNELLAADPLRADIDGLARLVDNVAHCRGQINVLASIKAWQEAGDLDEHIKARLIENALRADDSWSGRGNDIRRSYADGQRAITALYLSDF